jgi:hypothetical protein
MYVETEEAGGSSSGWFTRSRLIGRLIGVGLFSLCIPLFCLGAMGSEGILGDGAERLVLDLLRGLEKLKDGRGR